MSEDAKPWYLSKGFIAPLVTAVLMALRQFGVVDLADDQTLSTIYSVIEFAGVALGGYGRVAATQKLSLK